MTACDPEKERSRKILQPENDPLKDFANIALARVLFAESTFFEKISISGYNGRQELRIRMCEAVAALIGGWGCKTEGSPDRESKPSTQHPHRTHDTTDQWREKSICG